MGPYRFGRTALLLVAGAVGTLSLPAQACVDPRSYVYDSERPIAEYHFQGAETIFRGQPIGFRMPDPQAPTSFFTGPEITFEVLETYLGKERERWTALWVNTMALDPDSLQAFRDEVGDDLVVILEGPNDDTRLVTQLPVIRFGLLCIPAAMGRFSVMEPILRQKGLIE